MGIQSRRQREEKASVQGQTSRSGSGEEGAEWGGVLAKCKCSGPTVRTEKPGAPAAGG